MVFWEKKKKEKEKEINNADLLFDLRGHLIKLKGSGTTDERSKFCFVLEWLSCEIYIGGCQVGSMEEYAAIEVGGNRNLYLLL